MKQKANYLSLKPVKLMRKYKGNTNDFCPCFDLSPPYILCFIPMWYPVYSILQMPSAGAHRLSSVSSHDSGFVSQDANPQSKPPSPMPSDIASQVVVSAVLLKRMLWPGATAPGIKALSALSRPRFPRWSCYKLAWRRNDTFLHNNNHLNLTMTPAP